MFIGPDVVIEEGNELGPGTCVIRDTYIGKGNKFYGHSAIGGDLKTETTKVKKLSFLLVNTTHSGSFRP